MIYDKFDVENAGNNASLDLSEDGVELSKTKCKQCSECVTYEYERIDRNGNLQTFIYCDGNKDKVDLSGWYIQKDGYAYSTGRLSIGDDKPKKVFFHSFFKKDKRKVIDHVNGIRNDNRLSNLREITGLCNNQNYHHKRTSIFPGVHWSRKLNKFVAVTHIGKSGRESSTFKRLGTYDDELEAFHAYVTCLREDNRTVNTQTEAYRKYVDWLGKRQQSTLV